MSPLHDAGTLTCGSSEEEIAAAIDLVKQHRTENTKLLPYLELQHPLYEGRSANEVIRIRGYIFESFGRTGLPEAALPFVLEILESERSAYLVAGAARALRGLTTRDSRLAGYLTKAFDRLKSNDDAVSFASYRPSWPPPETTSALLELCKTFEWLGGSAVASVPRLKAFCRDVHVNERVRLALQKAVARIEGDKHQRSCCASVVSRLQRRGFRARTKLTAGVANLILEDHSGRSLRYEEYFAAKPTIAAFFYTRCDNPYKCSLTISRLAELQKTLAEEGLQNTVKIAAITYDPAYDLPLRLKSYCEQRGVVLNEDNRAFRIEAGMSSLLGYFDSGVNYIGSVVNQHATELFMIDPHGDITTRFRQLRWEIKDVVAILKDHLDDTVVRRRSKWKAREALPNLLSFLVSLLIVISPKCPICWAAYLGAAGISNIYLLRSVRWLGPVFSLVLCLSFFSLYRGAVRKNGFILPFSLGAVGIACLLWFAFVADARVIGYGGIGLLLAALVFNSLDANAFVAVMQSRLVRLKPLLRPRI
jgi:protein SCO1/2